MSLLDEFARVSRPRPCPVCNHPDWCLLSRDDEANPSKVICARVESRRRFGQAGWLHVLRDDGKRWNEIRPRTLRLHDPAPDAALATLADRFRANLAQRPLTLLARDLGLSVESLRRLGVGWNGWAWSFPMVDANGRTTGIHLRRSDGKKRSVTGSHLGLFVPTGLVPADQLLVCEGQTDTAAMLDLGFAAIGRPGCRSTVATCVALAKRLAVPQVVVVADADGVGRAGAAELAAALAVTCHDVRKIYPPDGTKDVREWRQRGATAADVGAAIEMSSPVTLGVRAQRLGRRT